MSIIVNNLVELRAINVASGSRSQLARFVGTLINDWQTGAYNGAAWTVTNPTALYLYNCAQVGLITLLQVAGTMVTDNSGWQICLAGFSVTNPTEDYEFDASSTGTEEVARVLAAFIYLRQRRSELASKYLRMIA